MKKSLLTSVLGVSLFAALASAFAAPDVPIYDGKAPAQDNLSVGSWGGGSAEDSTQLFLFGGHSLKVTTLDEYQGAKINFLTPIPLTGPTRMFQITLQRGGVTLHYDPQSVPGGNQPGSQNGPGGGRGRRRGGGGGGGGGFGGPGGGGGFGGPGGGGGFGGPGGGGFGGPGGPPPGYGGPPPGYGGPGGPGGFGGGGFGGPGGGGNGGGGNSRGRGRGGNTPAPLIPLITKLRLEFTLADGRQADVLQTIPDTSDTLAGDGWYSVNVPISALKFGVGTNNNLKSVTIGGDQFGVLFIGRMQIAEIPAAVVKPAAADTPADAGGDNGQPADEQNGAPMGNPNGPPGPQNGPLGRGE